jgi:hypothetical protein
MPPGPLARRARCTRWPPKCFFRTVANRLRWCARRDRGGIVMITNDSEFLSGQARVQVIFLLRTAGKVDLRFVKYRRITAGRIGANLPQVPVQVLAIEAVDAVLLIRLEDLAVVIFLLHRLQKLVGLAHGLFRVDVKPVVVEQRHLLNPIRPAFLRLRSGAPKESS